MAMKKSCWLAKNRLRRLIGRNRTKIERSRKKAAASMAKQVSAKHAGVGYERRAIRSRIAAAAQCCGFGWSRLSFRFAAHESMPLGSLVKVASGGELSRISLAIQVILSKIAAVPTLISTKWMWALAGVLLKWWASYCKSWVRRIKSCA